MNHFHAFVFKISAQKEPIIHPQIDKIAKKCNLSRETNKNRPNIHKVEENTAN